MNLIQISRKLSSAVDELTFSAPVTHVYNPLRYARRPQEAYLKRFGQGPVEALWLGMNPGPFGMAQTGVPFGDVAMVRDWMGICEPVDTPESAHPKRPVLGFASPRSEVSGTRLWSFARDRFGTPERFFARFFVWNYCPLCFCEAGGRNRTPDKLPALERERLFQACDEALRAVVQALAPQWVIGVGSFAEARARAALEGTAARIGRMPHPSPASPAANRGWAGAAARALRDLGVTLPGSGGKVGQ